MMKKPLVLLPVLIFAALALLFWRGLSGDPSTLPSVLLGKEVPEFALGPVEGLNVAGFGNKDLKNGKVSVVNIFASWCIPCRAEQPVLMELAKRQDIVLVGINNKDDPANAERFLSTLGQPYAAIGADTNGRVSIDFGGYGVPETYVIDGTGKIRYRHVGPLSPDDLAGNFAKELAKAATPLKQD